MMQATYDKQADAVYMQFRHREKSAKTVEIGKWMFADYNKRGMLIGIEILDAKKQVPAQLLKKFVRIDLQK
jgi:uncharacterized protein YuzE